jgi:hypothetical protein
LCVTTHTICAHKCNYVIIIITTTIILFLLIHFTMLAYLKLNSIIELVFLFLQVSPTFLATSIHVTYCNQLPIYNIQEYNQQQQNCDNNWKQTSDIAPPSRTMRKSITNCSLCLIPYMKLTYVYYIQIH